MKKLNVLIFASLLAVFLVGCTPPAEGDTTKTDAPTADAEKKGAEATPSTSEAEPKADDKGAAPTAEGEKKADDGHDHKEGEGH